MEITVKHTSTKPLIILNFILDESGSMAHQRQNVITGFNEYIQTMKTKTEADYIVNLIKFGDETEYVFTNKPLAKVREITTADYNPQYWTALRDGIGDTIYLTDGQMADSPNATTLFYIFTDGAENASTKYNAKKLQKMITSREAKGTWTFSFIGADKDCLKQAKEWGIQAGNTITYNPQNFIGATRAMVASTATYACNVSSGLMSNTATLYQDAGFDNSKNIDEQSVNLTDQNNPGNIK